MTATREIPTRVAAAVNRPSASYQVSVRRNASVERVRVQMLENAVRDARADGWAAPVAGLSTNYQSRTLLLAGGNNPKTSDQSWIASLS